MPTRLKEAEKQQKKEEEAMATITLQREKEATVCQRTAAVTPSGPIQVMSEPPLLLLSPLHPPPISTPYSPDMLDKKVREQTPTPPRLQRIPKLSKRILPHPTRRKQQNQKENLHPTN
jgi:hypothetical protein